MFRAISSLGALSLIALTGCATQMASVDGPGGRAELLRSPAGFAVRVDDGSTVRLSGLSEARLVGVMAVGEERAAVVAGAADGCRQAHVLIIAPRNGDPRAVVLPDCDREFSFSASGGQLLATHTGAGGVRRMWRYADGALTGPLTSSAAIARRFARPRPVVADADAAQGQAPASAGSETTPETVPAPTILPRVSRSVGNDVIPPEVRVSRVAAAPEVDLR